MVSKRDNMLINASYCPAENSKDTEVLIPHLCCPSVSTHNRFFKELILVVMSPQPFHTFVGGAGDLNFFKKN